MHYGRRVRVSLIQETLGLCKHVKFKIYFIVGYKRVTKYNNTTRKKIFQVKKKSVPSFREWQFYLESVSHWIHSPFSNVFLSSVFLLIFVFTVEPWVVDSCGRQECQFWVLKNSNGQVVNGFFFVVVSYFITCRALWDISVKNTR